MLTFLLALAYLASLVQSLYNLMLAAGYVVFFFFSVSTSCEKKIEKQDKGVPTKYSEKYASGGWECGATWEERGRAKQWQNPTKPEKHLCGFGKTATWGRIDTSSNSPAFERTRPPHAPQPGCFVLLTLGYSLQSPAKKQMQGGCLPSRLDGDLIKKKKNSQIYSTSIQTPTEVARKIEINVWRVQKQQQQHDWLRARALATVSQKANRFVRTALAGLDDLPKAFARGRQDIKLAVRRADKHSCWQVTHRIRRRQRDGSYCSWSTEVRRMKLSHEVRPPKRTSCGVHGA